MCPLRCGKYFGVGLLYSGTSTQPCGLPLSRYKSIGDSKQGGSSLGHHVLPVGLRSGPWGYIRRCHIHQAQSLVLSTAASTLCLPHFLRGACAGVAVLGHVACDEVLGVSCSWDHQNPRTRLQCQGIARAKLVSLPWRLVQNVTWRERERCGLFELAMSQAGKARWGECVPACLCAYK